MALLFGGAATDRVDHGSGSSVDNLNPLTFAAWIYPTSLSNALTIFQKGTFGTGTARAFTIRADGNLNMAVSRATTATSYRTNTTPLSANVWRFVAVTFDSGAGAGQVVNIYTGALTAAATEATYGTATDGSGAVGDDSAHPFVVGNDATATPASAFPGRIAVAAYFNRVLSLVEIQSFQFRRYPLSGCVLRAEYGYAGTGAQQDYSGSGNTGTVTGATVADHVPIPFRRSRFSVPYAVAAASVTSAFPKRLPLLGVA